MASSTRGGERGKSKPKKGTKKFRVGAREGSLEKLRTLYDKEGDYGTNRLREFTSKYAYGGKVTKMEEGGKVPSKYKGFSKLPENVQRQMDSGLAEKYEYGGKVGGCRGGGAAVKGTKFTGCK